MELKFYPYSLQLKDVFRISVNSRTVTPIVLTEIEHEGIIGYGEASLPPYLRENQESVAKFLSKIDLSSFRNPLEIDKILDYVDKIAPGNNAAKASIDIVLHDLAGKIKGLSLYKIFGLSSDNIPFTSFTIGIDNPERIREKVLNAEEFKILKVKLGSKNDHKIVETIREVTDKPITVDVNQGWLDKEKALEMINWLSEKNVLFVEQPLPKDKPDDEFWLKENSPIPIIADEAIQTSEDIIRRKDLYSGVNIKLLKSGGIREANKMIKLAKSFGMKILIGCMTETSCGISAASQLAPLADWVDLDGALLIKNDVFEGTKIIDGKVTLSNLPGIGVRKIT
jgi:L-Ala-D/L-Glu epimerase / N-acetyl-D-glutamate racemase